LRALVITADDFGAAVEINEAVERAHVEGVLTAASLMVGAPAAADAVARARRLPGLRVGLHLVLVDGRPVLEPAALPQLVGPGGTFRDGMVAAGAMMFFHPRARRQLEAEIAAQFAAFAATGLTLDHVNAHKHFHLHPTIAGAVLKVGRRFAMSAARIPIEPRSVLDAIEPGGGALGDPLVEFWASLARRRFRRAGILVADQVFGLRWTGAMNARRLRGLISRLPPGLSEIYLHPTAADAFAGSPAGYRHAEELAALLDPDVRRAAGSVRLGGFGDFVADRGRIAA